MSSSEKFDTVVITNVTLIRSTAKAGLFEIDGDNHWIPFSQLRDDSVDRDGDFGDIRIPRWLAEEKELEYLEEDEVE